MMSAAECRPDRLEAGARPHVGAVRIACAHRGRPHRPGQVVDLGIAERRLRLVLVDEAVAQPARVAAGKRLGHNGFGELRILQRGPVHGAAARFVGEQERRSELRRHRARRRSRRLTSSAVIRPPAAMTGSSTRATVTAASSSCQRLRRWALRRGRRCRGARPPTGPAPPSRRRRSRTAASASATVVTVPTVAMPASRSRVHSVGARQAERERRHLGPQVEQHLDLGRPRVVVEARAHPARRRSARHRRPAPRHTSRSPRASPRWAAGTNRLAPSGPVVRLRAPRRCARRRRRRSGSRPRRNPVRLHWCRRQQAPASTDRPPSVRRSPEPQGPVDQNRSASSPPIAPTAHSYHAAPRRRRPRHLTAFANCSTSCGSLLMFGNTVCRTIRPSNVRPARCSTRADRVLSTWQMAEMR